MLRAVSGRNPVHAPQTAFILSQEYLHLTSCSCKDIVMSFHGVPFLGAQWNVVKRH